METEHLITTERNSMNASGNLENRVVCFEFFYNLKRVLRYVIGWRDILLLATNAPCFRHHVRSRVL